jgi:manganese/zinc/iron transport system permease protein
LLTIGFDREFARSTGLPVRGFDCLFQLFLAFSIVVALQAVGVVLVSALLITPAATAYLLVNRMHHMLWVAAVIGMFSAVLGVFCSFLGSNLPTGPFMVLGASSLFLLAYLFAPRHGRFTRWMRYRARRRNVSNENTLKSIYRILEKDAVGHDPGKVVQIDRLAGERRIAKADLDKDLRRLRRIGSVEFSGRGGDVILTGSGLKQAQRVVRNHRLWELYLTNEADYASNHVHDDAEKIEHFLSEEKVAEIERQLDFPEVDPHGQPIPGRDRS